MRLAIGMAASLMLAACGWLEPRSERAEEAEAETELAERIEKACASQATYERLKEYVFDKAARLRNSDPRKLDPLAAHSVVRMEKPLVKSRDEELNITVCTGRFVLHLPPGIEDAFDGTRLIDAEVEYAAQAAADGSGLVYQMDGAEPIIYRLATLGLPERPMPRLVAVEDERGKPSRAEPAPAPSSAEPAEARTAKAPPPPEPPAPEPAPPRASADPSFNCRHAGTRSEKMVCASERLAAADRRMASAYYAEMARADPATKSELRRTRDRFLARRERCASEACVARVYEERTAEIGRIAGE
ncbi:MAG: lysozyme inhibitor LprI family protein [Sphingomonadaceae bacterium]